MTSSSHLPAAPIVTLFVCRTCGYKKIKNPDGTPADNPTSHHLIDGVRQYLADHHEAEAPHIRVRLSGCLSVCDQGIAWGLRAEDRFAYVMAHAPLSNAGIAELAATALAYLRTKPGGKMPKAEIPDSIRPHILTKLPPVD